MQWSFLQGIKGVSRSEVASVAVGAGFEVAEQWKARKNKDRNTPGRMSGCRHRVGTLRSEAGEGSRDKDKVGVDSHRHHRRNLQGQVQSVRPAQGFQDRPNDPYILLLHSRQGSRGRDTHPSIPHPCPVDGVVGAAADGIVGLGVGVEFAGFVVVDDECLRDAVAPADRRSCLQALQSFPQPLLQKDVVVVEVDDFYHHFHARFFLHVFVPHSPCDLLCLPPEVRISSAAEKLSGGASGQPFPHQCHPVPERIAWRESYAHHSQMRR